MSPEHIPGPTLSQMVEAIRLAADAFGTRLVFYGGPGSNWTAICPLLLPPFDVNFSSSVGYIFDQRRNFTPEEAAQYHIALMLAKND